MSLFPAPSTATGVNSVTGDAVINAPTGSAVRLEINGLSDFIVSAVAVTAGPVLVNNGGLNTSAHAAFTAPAESSGVAFVPNANFDTFVNVNAVATTAGTVTVTYGPTTGAENAWAPTTNLLAGMGENIGLYVPKGWSVIVTITGVTVSFTVSIHRI